MYSFFNLEPAYCSLSGSDCCFLICIQISQEAGKVVWRSHLLKNFAVSGDTHLIPGLERSLGGGHGNPLQYSYLENTHGQRSLADYSLWGYKELDTTERLNMSTVGTRGWAEGKRGKIGLGD